MDELERERAAVNATAEREIAEARARVEHRSMQMDAELARAFHAEVAPLVREWMNEPSRKTALSIAAIYRRFDQRAQIEIGEELWPGAMGAAFAGAVAKVIPSATSHFAQRNWGSDGAAIALSAFQRATRRELPIEVETALRGVEIVFFDLARSAGESEPHASSVAIVQLKSECATHRSFGLRESELLRVQREAAERASPASHVPLLSYDDVRRASLARGDRLLSS